MPNWTESMQQSFEYYIVDPISWKNKYRLDDVISCTISRDSSADTLGSAKFKVSKELNEVYIRVYLNTVQNGVAERFPLGTYLVETPSVSFDGIMKSVELQAYTPLIELKENKPTLGYTILKDVNTMEFAYNIALDNMRAPVVETKLDKKLYSNYTASSSDTWLSYLSSLVATEKYILSLDEIGRLLFMPTPKYAEIQPKWVFSDDNSSILYQDITVDKDMYGIPNVIEVIYSDSNNYYFSRVVNDDENSPVSVTNRGREIIQRVTNPETLGYPSQERVDQYAKDLLESSSEIKCTVKFSHGYCPVNIYDGVLLDYKAAGISKQKAVITRQDIECDIACKVSSEAVFTTKLWSQWKGIIDNGY